MEESTQGLEGPGWNLGGPKGLDVCPWQHFFPSLSLSLSIWRLPGLVQVRLCVLAQPCGLQETWHAHLYPDDCQA